MASILAVDLNYAEREMFSLLCSEEGHRSVYAATPAEALERLDREKFPLIVLSSFRASIDGSTLCAMIGNAHRSPGGQILFISDYPDQILRSLENGATDFIIRPVKEEDLRLRIKGALFRQAKQLRVFEEREFYKKAVKQEEELSSKILDKQIYLKDAISSMKHMKKDLEKSNRKLEKIAKYDVLSGLLNRQTLFAMMDVEIERALRTGTPLSGIMMDIDNFKYINDNYGHPLGDEIIEEIGRRLKDSLRKYDLAGRYGGEEFFIILPNTLQSQAYAWAERFRDDLCREPMRKKGHNLLVSASLGIAQFRPGDIRETWISRADQAMYRAKEGGRNRSVIEEA